MAASQEIVNRFLQLGGIFGRVCRVMLDGVGFQQLFYVVIHRVFLLSLVLIETKTVPTD